MSQRHGNVDFYAILEVEPSATAAEITAAYHSLARRYHPDVGSVSKEALRKFKSITAAYEVLSDERLRQDYDRRSGRVIPVRTTSPSSATAAERQSVTSAELELELPITPEEARYGGPCDIIVTFRERCPVCLGSATATCESCAGEGFVNAKRRLKIQIPRGVRTGAILRIVGKGKRIGGNEYGDLLLRLTVRPSW